MGSILFTIAGFVLILFYFITVFKEIKIKKNGINTVATVVALSIDKGFENESGRVNKIKVPVFKFEHVDKNGNSKTFRVKGKSNSTAKIYETTSIYYNPNNPEKEYYLPKKDFLKKYVALLIGLLFLAISVLMKFSFYETYLNDYGIKLKKDDFFLYMFISFFSLTALLFLIGQISRIIEKKASKTIQKT